MSLNGGGTYVGINRHVESTFAKRKFGYVLGIWHKTAVLGVQLGCVYWVSGIKLLYQFFNGMYLLDLFFLFCIGMYLLDLWYKTVVLGVHWDVFIRSLA